MNTAIIITKTEPEVKRKAQKIAKELGFSMSSLVNAWFRQLIKTKTVTFSTVDEEPTQYLIDAIKQSKEDMKAGRVSPTFDNAEDAIAWLDNPKARYKNGDRV